MIAVWAAVLLAAVWAAHWGAERLSAPLKKLRKQWGFSVAAGGSFLGLAAASPEMGINVTSHAGFDRSGDSGDRDDRLSGDP